MESTDTTAAAGLLRLPAGQLHKITPEIGLHPVDGGDGQAAGKRAAGGRAGGRISQPGPVALPLDGDLGDGPPGKRREGARDRLAGTRARCRGPARPGKIRPGCTSAAGRMPLALRTKKTEVPSVESLESYKLQLAGTEQEKQAERGALNQLAAMDRRGDDPLLGFISRTTLSAYESSGRLEQLAKKAQGGPKYPNFGLARRLELIAQIIKADFGTRIFYTSLDGFDTHANQLGTHAALLNELSDSIAAFHDDLAAAGQGDRVATADLQRVRPAGAGKRLAGDRSRGRGAVVPGRSGRQGRAGRRAPQPRRPGRRRPEVPHRFPPSLRDPRWRTGSVVHRNRSSEGLRATAAVPHGVARCLGTLTPGGSRNRCNG